MGCSVYCRTCAVPPRAEAEGMINIFANTKIITLLSTLKEWQLDIMQDDGLSQCICKTCEVALIKIDKFRLQAMRAKEYLQTRLHSLETSIATYGEVINDNENDLHDKTKSDGVKEPYVEEAIESSFQSEITVTQVEKKTVNAANVNESLSNIEQPNIDESGLSAVNEETGELSFESNIESSRPLEFQIILIEEEEEATSQWINEDENAGERGVQKTAKNNHISAEPTRRKSKKIRCFAEPSKRKKRIKRQEGSTTEDYLSDYKQNKKYFKKSEHTQNIKKCELTSNGISQSTQLHLVHKCTADESTPIIYNTNDANRDPQEQVNDLHTWLTTINEQVASFKPIEESNIFSADDLQSVLLNELSMQMINANVNILEEDFQIDEFESLLAAVDEQASTLGSFKDNRPPNLIATEYKENENAIKLDNVILESNNAKKSLILHVDACHLAKQTVEETQQVNSDKSVLLHTLQSKESVNYGRNNKQEELSESSSNQKWSEEFTQMNNKHLKTQYKSLDMKRSRKISLKGMRCRLCVCKVSDQPVFATKQLLDDHISLIHDDKERPYNCPECSARYRTRSGCIAHINAIHLKKGDKCELCDKIVVGGTGQMRMHIERNHTHGNYKCEICQMEFKNVSLYNFKYHKRWHNEDKLWRCQLCEKAFVTRTHLLEHKVTHTRQGDFLCTRCGKSKRSKWELRTHLYSIHGEGEPPLKCNYCDEKFTQHIQKRAHLERYHPDELAKRIVPCAKCEKHFSTATNLQRHIKQCHNADLEFSSVIKSSTSQYEGFMCAHCPRKYRSKYALIKHLRVHAVMEDRPYSCLDCEMHFKHFSELDRHDLQHHATVRPYRCDECYKDFSTKTALKIHGHVHEVNGRNFRCPKCNLRFKFEKSLNLHLISHTTMRHSCDICKKSYIKLSQLKTHKSRYHRRMSDSEEE
ncbi:zinc finger protein 470 isoform X3 [Ceratitis capitata]|uniref:Zinc finger protein 28 n=2 Tax=Ceratitis capitata TaxID=7213 RepID=W8C3N6_CERCA|nr:zinc finger protein 470 isoform X3 [Ceratitis capitata]